MRLHTHQFVLALIHYTTLRSRYITTVFSEAGTSFDVMDMARTLRQNHVSLMTGQKESGNSHVQKRPAKKEKQALAVSRSYARIFRRAMRQPTRQILHKR